MKRQKESSHQSIGKWPKKSIEDSPVRIYIFKDQIMEHTPAQSPDCPAFDRKSTLRLAFICGHDIQKHDHRKANALNSWRFA